MSFACRRRAPRPPPDPASLDLAHELCRAAEALLAASAEAMFRFGEIRYRADRFSGGWHLRRADALEGRPCGPLSKRRP
jgi:hypothetical protein